MENDHGPGKAISVSSRPARCRHERFAHGCLPYRFPHGPRRRALCRPGLWLLGCGAPVFSCPGGGGGFRDRGPSRPLDRAAAHSHFGPHPRLWASKGRAHHAEGRPDAAGLRHAHRGELAHFHPRHSRCPGARGVPRLLHQSPREPGPGHGGAEGAAHPPAAHRHGRGQPRGAERSGALWRRALAWPGPRRLLRDLRAFA